MGVYLSEPNKNKSTESGSSDYIKYAASSMQGWRTNMEDAHIADVSLEEDCCIFGVFDGHGGKEVALFVKKHFIEELKKNQNFKEKKWTWPFERLFF
jgi:serine/threonine protein phosphatase PrpC